MMQKGFSLLEVLISIVLLSFITLAVVTNTDENFEIKEKVVKEDKDRLRVYTALSMMEWDISQIYSPLYFSQKFEMEKLTIEVKDRNDPIYLLRENLQRNIDEQYRNNPLFYVPNDKGVPIPRFKQPDKFTFEFFTNSHRRVLENSKESNYAWVVYTLEDPSSDDVKYAEENYGSDYGDLGNNLVRYHIPVNPFNDRDINFDDFKNQVVMEKVDELEFKFWNSKTEKFTSLKEVSDAQGWVQAIKVIIKFRNIYNQPEKIERIFRPIWPLYNPLDDTVNAPTNGTAGLGQATNANGSPP